MKLPYRLSLDIGTNSIGWCVLKLDGRDQPVGIVRAGVRIFSDGRSPKTLASLAADRRAARQTRRRHDRVLKRMARFMNGLIHFGLMPSDDDERLRLSALDPYELRRKGMDQRLEAKELGRALYHLAKRRGFKSSRKSKGDANDAGKIASAISRTREAIEAASCRTIGEYLAMRHERRETVRARTSADEKEYLLYTQRALVADEFDALWAAQAPHHPNICSDEARDYLRDTLLFQRNLLPVEPGTCLLEPGESRIPQCSPLFQRFRLLSDLNHLRIWQDGNERGLALEERNTLLHALLVRTEPRPLTFDAMRKLVGLPRGTTFNYESDKKRMGFKGDATAPLAAAVGDLWAHMDSQQQEAIAVLVEESCDNEVLRSALQELPASIQVVEKRVLRGIRPQVQAWRAALSALSGSFNEEEVEAILQLGSLPDDYGSLSRRALEKIVPILEAEVITYDKAAKKAGYRHSDSYTGEIFPRLPYYGQILRSYTSPTPKAKNPEERQFGKLANPTVHIGLNQLRKLVNEVIRRWGWPREIIVELARDFGLSGQKRRDLESEQKQNQERNDKYNVRLRVLGQRENRDNRQRLMLWDELGKDDAMDRHCIYSGQRISMAQLFSGEVEIDHILPFSVSLDDSLANKVLCLTRSNRDKKNQTPYEAFGHSPGAYCWKAIEERASRLPKNKTKRFKPEALDAYNQRSKLGKEALEEWGFNETDGFLARHLTDTAYLSRLARQYLTAVCPPNKVWVATGRLTAILRGRLGLNKILSRDDPRKNRDDHRHHAVDAAVIGICDRSLIQRIATAAARAESAGQNRLLNELEEPWSGFRDELAETIRRIVVSHKPDHGREAGLHNDTNYGRRGDINARGAMLVSVRKPIGNLKSTQDAAGISDPLLRDELQELLSGLKSKEVKAALDAYTARTGIRRVRMEERLSVIPIEDRLTKQPYRYVKGDGNYCYDIYREEGGRWKGDVVSIYCANRPGFLLSAKTARNGKPLVMRLRQGDILKLEHEGRFRLMCVAQFSDGKIIMSEHNEANADARNRLRKEQARSNASDPDIVSKRMETFRYLQKSPDGLRKASARVVGVDVLGYVNDPGFHE